MGLFIPPFAILKPKVERFWQDICGMSVRDKYMYILFIQKKNVYSIMYTKVLQWNTIRWSLGGENFN